MQTDCSRLEDYGRRLKDEFAVGPSARLQSLAQQLRVAIDTGFLLLLLMSCLLILL